MAIIPSQAKAANAIVRILLLPCAVPPQVYIETAFAALVNFLYSFFEPDLRELYHHFRGNSLLCDVKGGLKSTTLIPPEGKSPATRFAFGSFEIFDRVTWFTFLAAITAETLIDWQTMIMELSPCDPQFSPYTASGVHFFGAIPDDGTWGTCAYTATPPSIYTPAWYSVMTNLARGKHWVMAGSVSFEDALGHIVPTSTRIINKTTGVIYDEYTQTQDDADGGNRAHVFEHRVQEHDFDVTIEMQHAYFGPSLPLHQAFQTQGSRATMYRQP